MPADRPRQFPLGAEVQPDGGGVHFRVWAPASRVVLVEFQAANGWPERTVPLASESGGYFAGLVPDARAGMLYKFRLESGAFPDPASRYQPAGAHGASQIVAPDFAWTDQAWPGLGPRGQVIYELHLGTFTPAGTWRAAMAELPELKRLGVTVVEIMPIAEFPGRFGWGYDGVNLFAPSRLYGAPDEVRAFVNRAHELQLGVILDVVYNHFGPDGNYLRQFSPAYFSQRHANEWGDALNFDDGAGAAATREFFCTNACYWISEFHFDGLRFDATQQIYDDSPRHVLAEIAAAARAAAGTRAIYLVAENENQRAETVRGEDQGGQGLDAIWNDDWHHSAMVAATGRGSAYYSDYRGFAQEFISAVKHGFLFQGQWYSWQEQRRGTPALDVAAHQFVVFLQNHDQVANALRGLRLHQLTSPGLLRALTALTLLAPQTPLLFQGQEFAASAPFLYFVDHEDKLNGLVRQGRAKFLQQFPEIATPEGTAALPNPTDPATFARCKLNFAERDAHRPIYELHADLLWLRREDAALSAPERLDGAVLHERAFVLRYFAARGDRLLIVNLGADLRLSPAPEPLLAPPAGRGWRILWSSDAPAYGGNGTPPLETSAGWMIGGQAAFVLAPDENRALPRPRLSEKN